MADPIPDNPDMLLRRRLTAEALTAKGYITSDKTLATKATRGGGPPYRLFGRVPLYRWGDVLAWAESRMSPPRRSTSEADIRRNTEGATLPPEREAPRPIDRDGNAADGKADPTPMSHHDTATILHSGLERHAPPRETPPPRLSTLPRHLLEDGATQRNLAGQLDPVRLAKQTEQGARVKIEKIP